VSRRRARRFRDEPEPWGRCALDATSSLSIRQWIRSLVLVEAAAWRFHRISTLCLRRRTTSSSGSAVLLQLVQGGRQQAWPVLRRQAAARTGRGCVALPMRRRYRRLHQIGQFPEVFSATPADLWSG
jgi:hypothetical protein